MPPSMGFTKALTGFLGIGCVGMVTQYVLERRVRHNRSEPSPVDPVTTPADQRLTQDMVNAVLRDPKTIDALVDLIKDVFTHPTTLDALKQHFKWQFTENPETVKAVKEFALQGIVKDQFVSEVFVDVSKDLGSYLVGHPLIYPKATLDLLGAAALDALRTERFQSELVGALRESTGFVFVSSER